MCLGLCTVLARLLPSDDSCRDTDSHKRAFQGDNVATVLRQGKCRAMPCRHAVPQLGALPAAAVLERRGQGAQACRQSLGLRLPHLPPDAACDGEARIARHAHDFQPVRHLVLVWANRVVHLPVPATLEHIRQRAPVLRNVYRHIARVRLNLALVASLLAPFPN